MALCWLELSVIFLACGVAIIVSIAVFSVILFMFVVVLVLFLLTFASSWMQLHVLCSANNQKHFAITVVEHTRANTERLLSQQISKWVTNYNNNNSNKGKKVEKRRGRMDGKWKGGEERVALTASPSVSSCKSSVVCPATSRMRIADFHRLTAIISHKEKNVRNKQEKKYGNNESQHDIDQVILKNNAYQVSRL